MLIQAVGAPKQVPEHVQCVSLPGEQQLLPGLFVQGLVRGVEMEDFFN